MNELLHPHGRPTSGDVVDRIKALVGPKGWSEDATALPPQLIDWRRRYQGRTPLLVRPAAIEAAPVGQPVGKGGGILDPAARPGGHFQPVDEIRRRVCGGRLEDDGHEGKTTVLPRARPEAVR